MNKTEIRELLNKCVDGNENSYHTLIELPNDNLPILYDEYRSESDIDMREIIVEVIWKHKDAASLNFLLGIIKVDNSIVWKQALDGIVAIAGNKIISTLENIRDNLKEKDAKFDWINEAIDQIKK
jgi:hypothetical protein